MTNWRDSTGVLRFKVAAWFVIFALCSSHFALAPSALAVEPADQILSAALQGHGAWDVLEHLSDNIGPRLSGSKQARAAVEWTTSTFRSWGIETRNEPVLVPHWVRGVETGRLVSHMDQRIVLTALGMSVATPDDGITGEVVEVSSFEELAAIGDGARGRVVLFNKALDASLVGQGLAFDAYSEVAPLRGKGASRAAEKGAVAMLIRSIGSASLRTPHTGALRYDEKTSRIPAAAVTTEDADLIHRLLAKGETVRIEIILTPRELPEAQSANVIAEIRGSEKPDEIVLLGGHLDSWDLGTGAIDDGSGVAMVMETMRILKASGLRPRRTIRAVLFMNEENGLRGGKAYFEAHQNENHVAAIETDGGATSPCGFVTTLEADSIARLRPFLARLERLGAAYLQSDAHTGADTSYLVDAGVPGFGLLTDSRHYFDYHHTPADTLDKVDPRELQQDTAVLATLAWELAQE